MDFSTLLSMNLPHILERILLHLDPPDIKTLRGVSKAIRTFVDDDFFAVGREGNRSWYECASQVHAWANCRLKADERLKDEKTDAKDEITGRASVWYHHQGMIPLAFQAPN